MDLRSSRLSNGGIGDLGSNCRPAPGRRRRTLGPTAQLLRQCTANTHRRVEAGLDLLGPAVTAARLATVLERCYGFWAANEPPVAAWLTAHRVHAIGLRAGRRTRVARLAADLALLGRDVADVPLATPVLDRVDAACALGWLYVTEGATLGGAVIERRLRLLEPPVPPLRFFTPYPEGPGPMWRGYLGHLEAWAAAAPGRGEAVAAAATAVFDALAEWLMPLAGAVPGAVEPPVAARAVTG